MKEGFTMSRYSPSAFKQREYVATPICKPYIFCRADLVNTEIIITILSKPVIKSAQSVRTYGRQFPQLRANRFCTKKQGLKCASIKNIFKPSNAVTKITISVLAYGGQVNLSCIRSENV